MKLLAPLLCAAALLCGCSSTIESRKQERYDAYTRLTPEQRAAVDAGQIRVGMPPEAVYIAWGRPSQIVRSESAEGQRTIWIYTDTYLQGYTYWGHGWPRPYPHPYFCRPVLYHEYVPVGYVKAEVVFEKDRVKEWRTLPAPGY